MRKLFFAVVIIIAAFCYTACNNESQRNGCIECCKEPVYKILSDVDVIKEDDMFDAAYVLGGTEESLLLKFQLCAKLYRRGKCRSVLVLDRPGFTEFSESHGRNLKNNEWAIERLVKLGIAHQDVIFVMPEYGFFGTLNEAKMIARIILEREYDKMLLVTARHHTKRVRITILHFLDGYSNMVRVVGTKEKASAKELVSEMIKLSLYRYVLLRILSPDLPVKKIGMEMMATYASRMI